MADSIIPGSEEFSFGYMKPGVDEEINALWGRKIAANDGVFAGSLVDTQLGHVKFMQGTIVTGAADSWGTAYLTEEGADGGVAVFTLVPSVQIWNRDTATSLWDPNYGASLLVGIYIKNGTMLTLFNDAVAVGTFIWNAVGI